MVDIEYSFEPYTQAWVPQALEDRIVAFPGTHRSQKTTTCATEQWTATKVVL